VSEIGRFIFVCDPQNFIVAGKAVKALQERGSKDIMIAQGEGVAEVKMYARRLKKSIRVQQVKP
jgi:hypothetical protein